MGPSLIKGSEAIMRIFVTGPSGWTGSAVLPELLGAGHQVIGLARSDAAADRVTAAGAEVLRGDLDDHAALRAGTEAADGVVHLAFKHDFNDFGGAILTDRAAVETMGEALAGTGKALVVTGATPALPGTVATENDVASFGPHGGRARTSEITLALAGRGVRAVALQLPRAVYDAGDQGYIAMLIAAARESGISGYIGDGEQRLPVVHRLDAARLFRLAVESAPAGATLHAVGEEAIRVRDLAESIGKHLGLPVGPRPAGEFGWLGNVIGTDQPASSTLTRELLGWTPGHPGLLASIEEYYLTR
jgi:nucleoside-diphosphate-sugar epimerase